MFIKSWLKSILLGLLVVVTPVPARAMTDGEVAAVVVQAASLLIGLATTIYFVKKLKSTESFFDVTLLKKTETAKDPFAEVAGAQSAKDQLKQAVDLFANKSSYSQIGAQVSKGMLLVGAPGNGKTSLARAFAKAAKCNFISTTGSALLGDKFIGSGVERVAELFKKANELSPVVVFIDELDALGSRDKTLENHIPTLNSLLEKMDGFDQSKQIYIIGATNRPEALDPALKRSGRLDLQVYVSMPNLALREEILKIHSAKVKLAADVDLADLASKTGGFSGADLKNLVNQAALGAVKRGSQVVEQVDFTAALSLVCAGRHFDPQSKLTFADVVGATVAKAEMAQVVDCLKSPTKYQALKARPASGMLLIGQSGNGKSMLARALAGEANCAFYHHSAMDFVADATGRGLEKLRSIFKEASQNGPAVIFIDEIEAIATVRSQASAFQIALLDEFLVQMKDLSKSNVVVIGATNREGLIDPSITKSGKLERLVWVPYLSKTERVQLFNKLIEPAWLASGVDLDLLAGKTIGFSGANLVELVNAAKLEASQADRTQIEMLDFMAALSRLKIGQVNPAVQQTVEQLKATAYHESGHALVGMLNSQKAMSLDLISLVPRNSLGLGSLGITTFEPTEHKYGHSEAECLAIIQTCMGGKAAEELILGVTSSGVANDLEQATNLATKMVCKFGMSKLGPVALDFKDSDAKKEIGRILNESYQQAKQLLADKIDLLHKLAGELLQKEELTGAEAQAIIAA
jgi:ATP-dependent metalloprotease FtsH